jgi:hypothetical protein
MFKLPNKRECYQCKTAIEKQEVIFTNKLRKKLPKKFKEELKEYFNSTEGFERHFQQFDKDFYNAPNLCQICFDRTVKDLSLLITLKDRLYWDKIRRAENSLFIEFMNQLDKVKPFPPISKILAIIEQIEDGEGHTKHLADLRREQTNLALEFPLTQEMFNTCLLRAGGSCEEFTQKLIYFCIEINLRDIFDNVEEWFAYADFDKPIKEVAKMKAFFMQMTTIKSKKAKKIFLESFDTIKEMKKSLTYPSGQNIPLSDFINLNYLYTAYGEIHAFF